MEKTYRELLEDLCHLAFGPGNDAVRLALCPPETPEELAALDLTQLQELKKNANGSVEVKLRDRQGAIQELLLRAAANDSPAETLLSALLGKACKKEDESH